VSFDLAVLAMAENATAEAVHRMFERCSQAQPHQDGELDQRIQVFYEQLRSGFPDYLPHSDESPWASTPLDIGIDHIIMNLRHGPASDAALQTIMDLAGRHDLVIYDPQSGTTHPPTDA
jgi:hypothetical protein